LENEDETISTVNKFLEENYAGLERRLKEGSIATFLEFEKNIRNFEEFFVEHGPAGPGRVELLLKFTKEKSIEASDYFIKTLTNEVSLQKEMNSEHITKLETELAASKESSLKE
jgi:hypothetical protein